MLLEFWIFLARINLFVAISMRKFSKNVLRALPVFLFLAFSTSCQKDHDLVSSYVINKTKPFVEQNGTLVKELGKEVGDRAGQVFRKIKKNTK
jgi:hypothetical protein